MHLPLANWSNYAPIPLRGRHGSQNALQDVILTRLSIKKLTPFTIRRVRGHAFALLGNPSSLSFECTQLDPFLTNAVRIRDNVSKLTNKTLPRKSFIHPKNHQSVNPKDFLCQSLTGLVCIFCYILTN
ncbi:hypothetical protein H5410_034551 [Solanum commersonii]|uniref:Uncharacterized protein n=1 Tax=Solanum commersonii TaxID=4109 RepID=A0A9J5YTM7_SOLCO|nr:hypothetical protein H5410_034551 [Solanum commersonii]